MQPLRRRQAPAVPLNCQNDAVTPNGSGYALSEGARERNRAERGTAAIHRMRKIEPEHLAVFIALNDLVEILGLHVCMQGGVDLSGGRSPKFNANEVVGHSGTSVSELQVKFSSNFRHVHSQRAFGSYVRHATPEVLGGGVIAVLLDGIADGVGRHDATGAIVEPNLGLAVIDALGVQGAHLRRVSVAPQRHLGELHLIERHLEAAGAVANALLKCLLGCEILQGTTTLRQGFDLVWAGEGEVLHARVTAHVAERNPPDESFSPETRVDGVGHSGITPAAEPLPVRVRRRNGTPALPTDLAALSLTGRRCTLASHGSSMEERKAKIQPQDVGAVDAVGSEAADINSEQSRQGVRVNDCHRTHVTAFRAECSFRNHASNLGGDSRNTFANGRYLELCGKWNKFSAVSRTDSDHAASVALGRAA